MSRCRVVGVGCFGKPKTFYRIFNKIIKKRGRKCLPFNKDADKALSAETVIRFSRKVAITRASGRKASVLQGRLDCETRRVVGFYIYNRSA
jgi:hypothetical protein